VLPSVPAVWERSSAERATSALRPSRGEEGRDPAKRRHRVVPLLPVGDATDEVAGTLQRIVDAALQGVGSSQPVGGLDPQPEQLVAAAEPKTVGFQPPSQILAEALR
jgi:hypothetical protein